MKDMKIGDLCTYASKSSIKAGEAINNGKYMFFTSGTDENKRYSDYQLDCEAIIMGTGGNATLHYYNGKFSTSTDCIVLIPNEYIRCKYLYYFFLYNINVLENGFKGAGLKHTNKNYISNIEINNVPNIETQDKIIKALNMVFGIKFYYQQQLQKLDELVKSRFIELFGDPKLNPRKWDMVTIGDIATDVRYGTSRPATDGGKYPYLRMNNLTYEGYLDLTDLKHIDVPDNEIEKCVVRNGDVLFNRTNSVELVGKTCVYNLDSDMIIAGYIIRVRIDDRVLPVILSSYLNSTVMKEQLRSMAKGAVNQANINAQELRSIPIYLPPITLQHEFATFVEQVDKSKIAVQQALDKAQLLFDSLMQKYFG